MNPSWEAIVVGAALFATMGAYALFSGADFGGGIWDLLAGGAERGAEPRAEIDASVTPVWEGNHVWIVLGLVLFWTGFPSAFATVMTAMFVPLSLSLLGLLLRGIGFAFRHEAERLPLKRLNGALFAASSIMAPFFLGTVVGAVATGRIRLGRRGNDPSAWINPVGLVTGALFVSACAYIGGIYLIGDSSRRGNRGMVRYFSRRTLAAGVVTGVLAGVNLLLMRTRAPYVYHRLLGPALPLVAVSVAAGLAVFVLVVLHRPWLLRITGGLAVAAVVAGWGVAQYPYLLPRTLSLGAGSAPSAALLAEIAVMGLALVLVVPSFVYLYWLQQHDKLEESESSQELRDQVAAENRLAAENRAGAAGERGHPVVIAVVVAAGAVELARDAFARLRRRR